MLKMIKPVSTQIHKKMKKWQFLPAKHSLNLWGAQVKANLTCDVHRWRQKINLWGEGKINLWGAQVKAKLTYEVHKWEQH